MAMKCQICGVKGCVIKTGAGSSTQYLCPACYRKYIEQRQRRLSP